MVRREHHVDAARTDGDERDAKEERSRRIVHLTLHYVRG
jgi:hypothetical protein